MSDQDIEKQIQEKGLTAPRVTPDQIDALVDELDIWVCHIPGTTTTVAVAFDKNGFSVANTVSACASPENFDEDIGLQIAADRVESMAREEFWKLEGYKLKCQLADAQIK